MQTKSSRAAARPRGDHSLVGDQLLNCLAAKTSAPV